VQLVNKTLGRKNSALLVTVAGPSRHEGGIWDVWCDVGIGNIATDVGYIKISKFALTTDAVRDTLSKLKQRAYKVGVIYVKMVNYLQQPATALADEF